MRLPREHGRPLAVGLLLLVLVLAYGLGLHWWWTAPMQALGAQVDELRQQELQARMMLARKPAIQKALADVSRVEAANPGFLTDATVELAQASLTQQIEAQVSQVSPDHTSCSIVQRTPTAWAGAPERFSRVLVQVRLLCGMNEFAALLHAFEGGRPELFVDNLNILSQRTYIGDNDATVAGQPLTISFDLYGYLRPGSASHAP